MFAYTTNLRAFREAARALVLIINNVICHDTAVLNATVAIGIYRPNRGRTALLISRFDVLFPLGPLVNPVNRIFPESGISLVTVVDAKVDMVTVIVSMRFPALTSGETGFLSLGYGYGNIDFEELVVRAVELGLAEDNLL